MVSVPMRAPALGVDDALGNPLAILVRQLFEQVMVLQKHRAAGTSRLGILVVADRHAGAGGEFFGHDVPLVWNLFQP